MFIWTRRIVQCLTFFFDDCIQPLIYNIFSDNFFALLIILVLSGGLILAVVEFIIFVANLVGENVYSDSVTIANNNKYYDRKKLASIQADERYRQRKEENKREAERRYIENEHRRKERELERKANKYPHAFEDGQKLADLYFKKYPEKYSFSYAGQTFYNQSFIDNLKNSHRVEFRTVDGKGVFIDSSTGEILGDINTFKPNSDT